MIDDTKYYTLDELHLGMRVYSNQLFNIGGMYIVLANIVLDSQFASGEIVYIGEELTTEQNFALRKKYGRIYISHHLPEEVSGEVMWDE